MGFNFLQLIRKLICTLLTFRNASQSMGTPTSLLLDVVMNGTDSVAVIFSTFISEFESFNIIKTHDFLSFNFCFA